MFVWHILYNLLNIIKTPLQEVVYPIVQSALINRVFYLLFHWPS